MTSNMVLLDVNVHLKKLNKYIYNKRIIVIMITIKSCDKVCQWLVTGQSLSVTCDRSKFVSDLWQIKVCQWLVTGQGLSVTCDRSMVFTEYASFPPPIKLTSTI